MEEYINTVNFCTDIPSCCTSRQQEYCESTYNDYDSSTRQRLVQLHQCINAPWDPCKLCAANVCIGMILGVWMPQRQPCHRCAAFCCLLRCTCRSCYRAGCGWCGRSTDALQFPSSCRVGLAGSLGVEFADAGLLVLVCWCWCGATRAHQCCGGAPDSIVACCCASTDQALLHTLPAGEQWSSAAASVDSVQQQQCFSTSNAAEKQPSAALVIQVACTTSIAIMLLQACCHVWQVSTDD